MVCGLFLHFKQILILAAGGRELWRGETEPARVYCGPNAGQEGQPQIAGVILTCLEYLSFGNCQPKGLAEHPKKRREDVYLGMFQYLCFSPEKLRAWPRLSSVGWINSNHKFLLWKMSSAPQMDSRFYIYGYLHEHPFFFKHPETPNGIHDFTWYCIFYT